MTAFATRASRQALLLAALLAAGAAQAQATYSGFLCCNMRTDGAWISDANYAENGKRVIPAGTPVTITGYGRNRVNTTMNGEKQDLGNDYSRDLSLEAFAKRYVVNPDPNLALNKAPAKVRQAVKTGRITPGMTREQVIMSLGWPISSENPHMDSKVWRFWLGSFEEFQVKFDGAGRVTGVDGDAMVRNRVLLD